MGSPLPLKALGNGPRTWRFLTDLIMFQGSFKSTALAVVIRPSMAFRCRIGNRVSISWYRCTVKA